MKINPFRPVDNNPYKRQVSKTEQPQAPGKTDKVEISAEAKEMQQTPSIVKEREARISDLKNQVQSGNYKIDHKAVAKSIAKFFEL
ncbi:flagellar biosynthesis anti-sigma factor FlgM [Lederbergia citrea]|uniref:flagellar biosynthesis anti-sigma factor FlgM n=1 Tax=Lederbergia citrea TaxID=2833581 RepID=UPI001BC8ED83|nr:flagellar biosynthesis anti-sigma factor FlgM [Lederbergia citrea]MBS4178270.1 flagellar biosynthesis anti-sigma factor FlgM [Lederbergia citrea]